MRGAREAIPTFCAAFTACCCWTSKTGADFEPGATSLDLDGAGPCTCGCERRSKTAADFEPGAIVLEVAIGRPVGALGFAAGVGISKSGARTLELGATTICSCCLNWSVL